MDAVIGHPFTFQVLFVNGLNVPIVVNTPTISVFTFSGTGVKQYEVNAQPMLSVVPAEVGRYTYTYTLPLTITGGEAIYAEMTGIDPVTFTLLRTEQELSAIFGGDEDGCGGGCCGLTARFVQGPQTYHGGGGGPISGGGPCGCP